jgi:hypothetical protein
MQGFEQSSNAALFQYYGPGRLPGGKSFSVRERAVTGSNNSFIIGSNTNTAFLTFYNRFYIYIYELPTTECRMY